VRHKREDLQYKVGDERTHQVLAAAGVDQGHGTLSDVQQAAP
jgi:hypothetical protein